MISIEIIVQAELDKIKAQLPGRTARVSSALRNSVFKCFMGNVKALEVKHILEKIIDKDYDSLRFYYLGNQYENKVEHIGVKPSFKLDDVLIL
mgnify:CR=1 FL=1